MLICNLIFTLLPISTAILSLIICISWCLWKAQRSNISTALIISSCIFVTCGIYVTSVADNRSRQLAIRAQALGAEIALRLSSASENLRPSPANKPSQQHGAATDNLRKNMIKASDLFSPPACQNSTLLAYHAILQSCLKRKVEESLNALRLLKAPESQRLSDDLTLALKPKEKLDKEYNQSGDSRGCIKNSTTCDNLSKAIQAEGDLKTALSPSWYRTKALEALYSNTKQPEKLAELLNNQRKSDISLMIRYGTYLVSVALAFLAGLVIIIIKSVRMWKERKQSSSHNTGRELLAFNYTIKGVAGILLLYLATRVIIRQSCLDWFCSIEQNNQNALKVVLITTALLLIGTGSTLVYSYLLVMRPSGTKLLDGINWHFSNERIGPAGMIWRGIATYLVCVCLVLACVPIGMLIGQGESSNPILSIIDMVAHSGDVFAIISLYLTIAIIGPFIEEAFVRGFLYSFLRQRLGILSSIVLSSLFFALYHFDFSGFFQLALLGAAFAYATEQSKSIVPGFIAHGLWNASLLTSTLLFIKDY